MHTVQLLFSMFKFTLKKNKDKAKQPHMDSSVISSCTSSIEKLLNQENIHPIFKIKYYVLYDFYYFKLLLMISC